MQTLYDFGIEVQKIREAVNNLTVKGSENASLVVYAVGKCNDIIQAINEIVEKQSASPEDQNGDKESQEEVEIDGEQDSGTITAD